MFKSKPHYRTLKLRVGTKHRFAKTSVQTKVGSSLCFYFSFFISICFVIDFALTILRAV